MDVTHPDDRPDVRGYVVDMDGVLVDFGSQQPIRGAAAFVSALQDRRVPYAVLTNNCEFTRTQLSERLRSMGLDVPPAAVHTSAMAAAHRLSTRDPGGTVYVVGGQALKDELTAAGMIVLPDDFDAGRPLDQLPYADHVVVGQLNSGLPEGTHQLDTRMFQRACLALSHGADFVSTDLTTGGPEPGSFYLSPGSWAQALEAATGVAPECVGKPARYGLDAALASMHRSADEVVVVGDSLNTDIRIGDEAGAQTALVLTGNTTREHLAASTVRPTAVFDSVAGLVDRVGSVDPLRIRADAPDGQPVRQPLHQLWSGSDPAIARAGTSTRTDWSAAATDTGPAVPRGLASTGPRLRRSVGPAPDR